MNQRQEAHPLQPASLARRALTVVFVALALGFVALTVVRNWEQVEAHQWTINWPQLVLSTVGLVFVLGFAVAVWRRVLGCLE